MALVDMTPTSYSVRRNDELRCTQIRRQKTTGVNRCAGSKRSRGRHRPRRTNAPSTNCGPWGGLTASEIPGRVPAMGRERVPHGRLVLLAEGPEPVLATPPQVDRVPADPVGPELLVDEGAGEDLVGRRGGQRPRTAGRSAAATWGSGRTGRRSRRRRPGVERGPVPQHQGHHDLIAGVESGTP